MRSRSKLLSQPCASSFLMEVDGFDKGLEYGRVAGDGLSVLERGCGLI